MNGEGGGGGGGATGEWVISQLDLPLSDTTFLSPSAAAGHKHRCCCREKSLFLRTMPLGGHTIKLPLAKGSCLCAKWWEVVYVGAAPAAQCGAIHYNTSRGAKMGFLPSFSRKTNIREWTQEGEKKGADGLSQQGAREVSKISSREEEGRRGKWGMVRYGKRKIFVKLLRFPIHSGKFSHIYSICGRERVISLRPLFSSPRLILPPLSRWLDIE